MKPLDPDEAEAQRLARKSRRQEARRQQLLGLAREIVLQEGLAALTIPRLARAADLGVPSLYYYFPGLDAIVEELAAWLLDEETAVVLAAVQAAPDGPAALQALVRSRVRFYLDRPELFRLAVDALSGVRLSPEAFQQRVYPASRRLMDPMEARLLDEQARGLLPAALHPRRLANVAFCMAQGILDVSLGVGRMGGEMRFAAEALVDEACLALALACRLPRTLSG